MSEEEVAKPRPKRGLREGETYWQKTVRKCTAEPFVPIGGLVTAGILIMGLRSFTGSKNAKVSQNWMRARVVAQGFTILAIALGSEFIKPNRPAHYEEQMERTSAADALTAETFKADDN